MPAPVPDDVDEVVAAAGCGAVVRRIRPGAGQRNDVWLVETTTGGAVAVRFLADGRRREMEVALLERAAAAGVPVAEVLWSAADPHPVLVQRRLEGNRLADVAASDGLCASVADSLRAIHAVPVGGGFGNLGSDLRGEDECLSDWFTRRVEREADAAVGTCSADDGLLLDEGLALLQAAEALLDSQPSGLAHGDVQPFNLLVAGDRVTGVLDWEAAKAGPPAFDLGWWDWFSVGWSTPWPTELMLDRYDPDHRLHRDELAELRRLVVLRVWLRELIAATTKGEEARAAAARRGLARLRR